jgi:hypothetical protein
VNSGRGAISNVSGSCKWQGGDSDGSCVANIAGDVEICWNGEDDDNDLLIDCSDPGCYSDSFCGLVEGDCFNWNDNNTCLDNSCDWVTDKWGSWCDIPGGQCWKNDGNETTCSSSANCEWQNGTGSGWCEQDWGVAETCFAYTGEVGCNAVTDCLWNNDTWCDGGGNGTDWCDDYGGWCDHSDFSSKDCWQYTSSSSECSGIEGCTWRIDEWSSAHCEVNWSGACWNNTDSSSCSSAGCWWNSNWNWCGNKMEECWQTYDEVSCFTTTSASCSWNNYSGGGGTCQPSCYVQGTYYDDEVSCKTVSGCEWRAESGWCEEEGFGSCSNGTNYNTEANCATTAGCKWRDPGWCNPVNGFTCGTGLGGGFGGGFGSECFKYDSNEAHCKNSTIINISCGWTTNPTPSCEVNWGVSDCWQYGSASDGCNVTNKCWWNNDQNWCGNLADECWSNTTLQDDATQCNTNAFCNYTSYGWCEPTCYTRTTTDECTDAASSLCQWNDGWCSSSGVIEIFDEIESGASTPLGFDICDGSETSESSVDICEFGMKDMGDAYGFGIKSLNLLNSSICNKEKISKYFIPGSSSDTIGSGNESISFITYIDTDGVSTGGCSLVNNASAVGYEFRFRYSSKWNASKEKASETFTSYKCSNNNWKLSDIKVNTWKKIMCSDIGGPMIAVEKGELSRFPNLYDSTKDFRVYVATVGEVGNSSVPSDTAGPGYASPGATDFKISGAFEFGADTAKFEDILRKGYIQGEDCFNSIDDDNDGAIDCNDWDCQFSSTCSSTGVNDPSYVDTKTPQVTGIKIEEYHDSALIIYDTNKPSNGSLEFYSNDSRCSTINATVNDPGVTNGNVREFKLSHKAELYSSTLGFNLNNDTKYYYKLQVCDNNGKCAKSKCTPIVTAIRHNKCGFCNFVSRIKTTSDFTVSYDTDQDGTYEHIQGQVCGPNAGLKSNYSIGRNVNIKLEKTDSSVYFEFINASLTKTGLNDKVRSISTAGDIIASSTTVGLTSNTRDKIINNLNPEECRIKVPFTGTCNQLHHCDDNGENCVDRTSAATLLDSTNCIWKVPFCEFSTYREAIPSTSTSSSSSGGGGGGGGGGIASSNATTSDEDGSAGDEPGLSPPEQSDDDEKRKEIGGIFGSSGLKAPLIIGMIVAIVIIATIIIFIRKRKV